MRLKKIFDIILTHVKQSSSIRMGRNNNNIGMKLKTQKHYSRKQVLLSVSD